MTDMKILSQLDADLAQTVQGTDILGAIVPINYASEKQRFFASLCASNPVFEYEKPAVDSFSKKRALFNLPIDALGDDDLAHLYSDVIGSYVDKLDQIHAIGTPEFRYNSLRYFGEPSDKDIRNAQFILHLPNQAEENEEIFTADAMAEQLTEFAQQHGYAFQVRIEDSMIANALVNGTTLKINRNAQVSATELRALAHHELGVHLATTLNARSQPLKVMSLGCPLNTLTQEGLAILCEYLSGCLTLPRLKVLALRVLAVNSMIHEKDFCRTFAMLRDEHGASDELAFTVTARVYRGGGFTKDYLYLSGFHQVLNAYESEQNFLHLLSGKATINYLPVISRLIDKGFLQSPSYISPAISNPAPIDPIQQFIAHAIK